MHTALESLQLTISKNMCVAEGVLDLEKNGAWQANGEQDGCEVWLASVKGKSMYAVRGRTRIKKKPLWSVIPS